MTFLLRFWFLSRTTRLHIRGNGLNFSVFIDAMIYLKLVTVFYFNFCHWPLLPNKCHLGSCYDLVISTLIPLISSLLLIRTTITFCWYLCFGLFVWFQMFYFPSPYQTEKTSTFVLVRKEKRAVKRMIIRLREVSRQYSTDSPGTQPVLLSFLITWCRLYSCCYCCMFLDFPTSFDIYMYYVLRAISLSCKFKFIIEIVLK